MKTYYITSDNGCKKLYNYFNFEDNEVIDYAIISDGSLRIHFHDTNEEGPYDFAVYEVQTDDLKERDDFNEIMNCFDKKQY